MTKCSECESQTIEQIVDLTIEYDALKNYVTLLENSNDITQELNAILRQNNKELREKLELWKNKNE